MIRNGLLGGIWYIRRLNTKDPYLDLNISSVDSLPDYLNIAEGNHFGHLMSEKSLLSGESYFGYGGLPVAYIGSEFYRQYLLLSQDKTDIQTSLTFITIDTVGVGAVSYTHLTLPTICSV